MTSVRGALQLVRANCTECGGRQLLQMLCLPGLHTSAKAAPCLQCGRTTMFSFQPPTELDARSRPE